VSVDLLGEVYHGYIMIRTVAELLRALQEAEIQQIEKAGIRHAPTIGEMYEGLTSSILDKAIPSEAGLRVVSGFVLNGSAIQSGQIDCILVFGEGTPLPYSKHSKWHVRDVVAVLEVKKRLFSSRCWRVLQYRTFFVCVWQERLQG
jgi:hypothetical protein